jgi:thiosulfate/3-mercaptopyruvate sulfurtransferase
LGRAFHLAARRDRSRNYHYVDGGLPAWLAEGMPMSIQVPPAVGGPVA